MCLCICGVANPETDWVHAHWSVNAIKLGVFDMSSVGLAGEAARNYRTLRTRGHTVRRTSDCLIAAFYIRSFRGHA